MSTSKLDTSGVFHTVKAQPSQTRLSLPAHHVRFHKNGIQFKSEKSLPLWTELTVDLHSSQNRKLHCNGVVVACVGNRYFGYSVSVIFMNLSARAQHRLDSMALWQVR